jgi:hypothetical protein
MREAQRIAALVAAVELVHHEPDRERREWVYARLALEHYDDVIDRYRRLEPTFRAAKRAPAKAA